MLFYHLFIGGKYFLNNPIEAMNLKTNWTKNENLP